MLFDISLNRGFSLICFLQDHLIWLSFTRVYVIADVLLLKTKMSNSRWHPTALTAGSRPSFYWEPRIFINLQPSSTLRSENTSLKPSELPQTKLLLLSTMHNLTWPEQSIWRRALCRNPTIEFFSSIRGTNHRFPTLSFFPPAAVKLLRLLTFGIIPDSLWTFLSRCQLLWNVLRGSGSTPVAAAVV